MEQGRHNGLIQVWGAFLSDLDSLTDPEKHKEYFKTYVWDRLFALQSFASRIARPNDKLAKEVMNIRDKILEDPKPFENEEKYKELLESIEEGNRKSFRRKKGDEVA